VYYVIDRALDDMLISTEENIRHLVLSRISDYASLHNNSAFTK